MDNHTHSKIWTDGEVSGFYDEIEGTSVADTLRQVQAQLVLMHLQMSLLLDRMDRGMKS
jgi:hypothetical protein